MAIAIGSGVLVPKTDHVSQLVHHYSKLVAILPDTYRLWPVPSLPDERAAPLTLKLSTNIFINQQGKGTFLLGRRKSNSPARPLREEYIIRMLLGYPFHEFHAGEILPVSHRLFEQSFVGAGKISIDLVRDHPVIPHPLLPSRRRSPRPARQPLPRGPALPRHLFRPVLHVVELDRTQLPIVKRHHLVRGLVQLSFDRRNLSTAMPPLRRSAKILRKNWSGIVFFIS